MQRIRSLQYLRALAALGVVVFHATESSPYHFDIGQAGVDIFFVISGFIMATLMLGPESEPLMFAQRRIIRIVPLYWAATLAAVAVTLVKPAFLYHIDISASNILSSLFFLPHIRHPPLAEPVLWQGWTLEYEMFFYALCTAALFAPARYRIGALLAALVVLVLPGAVHTSENPALRVYTNPLLLEFGAGVLLGSAWHRRLTLPPTLGAILAIVGVGSLALEQAGFLPASGLRVLDWGAPALLIVAGALALEAAGRVPNASLALLLGDASYSLYLTHDFVVTAIVWLMPGVPVELRVLVSVVAACAAAIATHLLFEKPITRALNAAMKARRTKPALDAA